MADVETIEAVVLDDDFGVGDDGAGHFITKTLPGLGALRISTRSFSFGFPPFPRLQPRLPGQ
jgi:hypothetical protein